MKNYVILLTPGERGWGGLVPDLPGCYTAGLTREETLANAQEAIALWIEDARAHGEPIPEPVTTSGTVGVDVPNAA